MINIRIDGYAFTINYGYTILEACKYVGITFPRFCFHETLSVSGNCRMCLVEIQDIDKQPLAACINEIAENMNIWTISPATKKTREIVLEMILRNHPLDCPICDQSGECDLQDQAKTFGNDRGRLLKQKSTVEDKYMNLFITTIMTRCITCTRCVRFSHEISDAAVFGTLSRGQYAEIGFYSNNKSFASNLSGNVIDLCPVGAITTKASAFESRPWEYKLLESIDLLDGIGSNIFINFKEGQIHRIIPKTNNKINNLFITDRIRFSYDAIYINRSNFKASTSKDLKSFQQKNKCNNENIIKNTLDYKDAYKNKKKTSLVTILIDQTIDFYTLNGLKYLDFIVGNEIKVCVVNPEQRGNQNFYINKNISSNFAFSTFQDCCIVVGANIKKEASILHYKLIARYKKDLFLCYNAGLNTEASDSRLFKIINLTMQNFISIFEAKSKFSQFLNMAKKPVFILGNQLKNRLNSSYVFNQIVKQILPNSLVINIKNYSNTVSCEMLNLQPVSSRKIRKSLSLMAYNLNENQYTRSIMYNKIKSNSNIFWYNAHNSNICLDKHFFQNSIVTNFEQNGIFINLDEKIQKISEITDNVDSFKKRASCNSFVEILFEQNDVSYTKIFENNYISQFANILKDPKLTFNETTKLFSCIKNFVHLPLYISSNQIFKLPLKEAHLEYTKSDSFTRNSKMLKNHRDFYINF